MAKFFITLTRQITIKAQMDIEAETEEEARAKALELASWDNARDDRDNGIEWESDRIHWLDATDPEVNRVVELD
ncbi:MAG: hypothetical protein HQL52_20120 [Magnetococcales bacterium]|nr:hypothetical protein [Magnetococcales bacterium]